MKEKYKLAFMDMAVRFGQATACERRQVGALLVKDGSIISEGCNGTRAGYPSNVCEDEEGLTLPHVRHAEIAALDKLRKKHDTSIGAWLFVSTMPCLSCAIELVDAGITCVYYRVPYSKTDGIDYLIRNGVEVWQI